jgi:hypothetical protein
MKQHQKFIPIIVLLVFAGITETNGQNNSLIGVWEIKKTDYCTRVVVPGAKVNKSPMQKVNGTITFNADGKGVIKSNTEILCNYSTFRWNQSGDSLILTISTHNSEFPAYMKFTFQDQNKVKIEKVFGCGRYGLGIWYDLVLERIKDPEHDGQ